ncbi:outer membrane lipoprotein-sorting protein [Hahella ganghwensis]|uniref:outer membrane lipoprotein-sorting protein n=1 Tax=Hahella ganghwensis TaxID=286420 RepID=UPI00037A91E9|nr:outer membrane lipoprotein-sorting protein [Hahella ganghwensis]
MKLTKVFFGIGLLTLTMGSLAEMSAEDRGLEIAKQADRRDRGWKDSQAEVKMILINKSGDETVRDMRMWGLEVRLDGDKSLTIFDSPRDVRGTKLLTYSHKVDDDDQWLYLPALKRVKRIASKNKSGPFMGSEFAFEDLSSQEVEKYTYKYLRDEPCPAPYQDIMCFVVESYPVDENSGYSKQINWIDQQEYRTFLVEFYDRKDSLLKTLTATDFKQYLNKYWRAHHSLMENKQTGKKTLLKTDKIEFKTGLDDNDFTQNSLKRAR